MHFKQRLVFLFLALCLACHNLEAQSLLPAAQTADYVLLGEVHDNADAHSLRLDLIKALQQQHPVALAMEQFNLENSAALQQAWQQLKTGPATPEAAQALAKAGKFDFKGWHWEFYAPVVELSLERGLPLAAANLSRRSAAEVMEDKNRGAPQDAPWSATQEARMEDRIRVGHCNQVEGELLQQLARAQRARDYEMAKAMVELRRQTGRVVVLLAGNGHAENQLGVPFWLHFLDPKAQTFSVGILEKDPEASAEDEHYQQIFWVKKASRSDPCANLHMQKNSPPTPAQLVPAQKM